MQINYTFAKEAPTKAIGPLPNSARRPKKSILKTRSRQSNGNVDFKFSTASKTQNINKEKGESKTTKNIKKFDFWDIEALKAKAKSKNRRKTKQKSAWLDSETMFENVSRKPKLEDIYLKTSKHHLNSSGNLHSGDIDFQEIFKKKDFQLTSTLDIHNDEENGFNTERSNQNNFTKKMVSKQNKVAFKYLNPVAY